MEGLCRESLQSDFVITGGYFMNMALFFRSRNSSVATVSKTTNNEKESTMKTSIKTVLAAAALAFAVAGTADATLVTIGQANYNSSSYNLVWDNNSPFGSVVYLDYSNAANTWANQVSWASSLNSSLTYTLNAGYSVDWGTNSWRLPTTVDDSVLTNYWGLGLPSNYWYSGYFSNGYNNTTSEFGHLYYTELGNKGYVATNGSYPAGWGLTNKGDLTNLQPYWYWSGTECAAYSGYAWSFNPDAGRQGADYEGAGALGLAVRSGQVSEGAPVPEPSTMLLLSAGIGGLLFARRRVRG
jgi:hypothetical protein